MTTKGSPWTEWEEFKKRSDSVSEECKRLIDKWNSIPWWQFWKRPSFNERKNIILNIWKKFNQSEGL